MAWLKIHDSLPEHDKVHELSAILHLKDTACVGMLVCLWLWALTNAEDGDLSGKPPASIARACRWKRSPALLLAALKEARFLDEDGKIHDWLDYAGGLLQQKKATRERVRRYRNCNAYSTLTDKIREEETREENLGVSEDASGKTKAAGGGVRLRPLSKREEAMRQVYLSEMAYLAGDEARETFRRVLDEHDFSDVQITKALEYARRKKDRGEILEPLPYVHQVLLDWESAGVRDEESITQFLRRD